MMTTMTPMIQKILFMLHPSVAVMPHAQSTLSNDQPIGKVPVPSARPALPSIALCSNRATLRAIALAYQRERLRGQSDSSARDAAAAVIVNRHQAATPASAKEAVVLMLAAATAPDPDRATLRAVATAYRDARHGGMSAPMAYEAAVDAYLGRHPRIPPLDAYGAVARILAIAIERSPRWFWRGMSTPRGNDL